MMQKLTLAHIFGGLNNKDKVIVIDENGNLLPTSTSIGELTDAAGLEKDNIFTGINTFEKGIILSSETDDVILSRTNSSNNTSTSLVLANEDAGSIKEVYIKVNEADIELGVDDTSIKLAPTATDPSDLEAVREIKYTTTPTSSYALQFPIVEQFLAYRYRYKNAPVEVVAFMSDLLNLDTQSIKVGKFAATQAYIEFLNKYSTSDITSKLYSEASANRSWKLPDKNGTLATTQDIIDANTQIPNDGVGDNKLATDNKIGSIAATNTLLSKTHVNVLDFIEELYTLATGAYTEGAGIDITNGVISIDLAAFAPTTAVSILSSVSAKFGIGSANIDATGSGIIVYGSNGIKYDGATIATILTNSDANSLMPKQWILDQLSSVAVGGGGIKPAVNKITDLKALNTTEVADYPDKVMILVEEEGLYRFDRESTIEDTSMSSKSVIAPTTGVGRWMKLSNKLNAHDLLDVLQGGTTGEYYHLTLAQHTFLTSILSSQLVTANVAKKMLYNGTSYVDAPSNIKYVGYGTPTLLSGDEHVAMIAPPVPTISAKTSSGFTMSWTNITGNQGYIVTISSSVAILSSYDNLVLTTDTSSLVVTGLTPNTTYKIRIATLHANVDKEERTYTKHQETTLA